jgi:hypothetical protein
MRRNSVRVRHIYSSMRVRRRSVRVRRSSVGCGVAQLVVRPLIVWQARVRFSARHPREVFPTELTSDEEMERNLGEWQRMNLLYECNGMNLCTIKYQNKQKEWDHATKPVKKNRKGLLNQPVRHVPSDLLYSSVFYG